MVKHCFFLFLFLPLLSVSQPTDEGRKEHLVGAQRVTYLNDLSRKYFNNDAVKAMKYAKEALILAREVEDKKGESSSLNNIGVIYKNKGRLDMALSSYLESLKIEETEKLTARLSKTYSNIGTLYALQNDYNKALSFFKKSLKVFLTNDEKPQIIGALNNIGNIYVALGKPDSALYNYERSLEIYEGLKDNKGVFVPYGNIGNIYLGRKDLQSALDNFNRALALERSNQDLDGQANALYSIGLVHQQNRDSDTSITFFNDALTFAQQTENASLLEKIYESLAESYFMKNDLFMAYSFLKLHGVAKDSLYNKESAERIAELESKYELETKENELKELRSENEIQDLRIKNDNIFMLAIALVSVMGIIFTVIVVKELKYIRKNKRLLETKNDELENQKLIIEEKNQSITESIDYARSVQRSILQFQISPRLEDNFFILFRPKDIVSGDFYWYAEYEGKDIIAAVDCTGHGVAGAFMTVIGSSCLQQVVTQHEAKSPGTILDQLSIEVSKALKQSLNGRSDHGMDVSLCMIDYEKRELRYAGANRPLYYFQNGEFKEIKGTRRSIGNIIDGGNESFEEHIVQFEEGDSYYLTSDGYADQFGGVKNKKFMTSKFKKTLGSIQHVSMNEQKARLRTALEDWQGYNEQTDDILLIGFRM